MRNRRQFLKTGLGGIAGLSTVPLLGGLAGCQTAPGASGASTGPAPVLQTQKITDRISVISGAPGNVVVLTTEDGLLLVDSGSAQAAAALRKSLGGARAHTLFNTHYHADHLYGLDDLRPIPKHLGGPVPLYCNLEVEQKIRQAFSYAFSPMVDQLPAGYLPKLCFHRITAAPFSGM